MQPAERICIEADPLAAICQLATGTPRTVVTRPKEFGLQVGYLMEVEDDTVAEHAAG